MYFLYTIGFLYCMKQFYKFFFRQFSLHGY